MSYILDALKRADVERARGAVPGLHTQPLANPPDSERTLTKPMRWWLFSAAVVFAMAALGVWRWPTPNHMPPAPLPVPLPAPTTAPITVPLLAPLPAPLPAQVSTPPAAQPLRTTPAVPTPPPKPVTPNLTKAVSTTPQTVPIPLVDELPEQLRRQLPPLAITGAVYADSPSQRLLLVNNQVLPQGSQLSAELTLIEIQPHSAVFTFHQTRFRVRY